MSLLRGAITFTYSIYNQGKQQIIEAREIHVVNLGEDERDAGQIDFFT